MGGQRFLAFDLGAESGRAVMGELSAGKLALSEVHRFPNEPVLLPDGLHWDSLRLHHEIESGLRRAVQAHGPDYAGIAVDTWGVDYGLLGQGDLLLGEPYHYRDHRTDEILAQAFSLVPRDEIFAATGIRIMPINTLFQLLAARAGSSTLLESAENLLFMPGLFAYFLSGERANDATIVSTSQCFDVRNRSWAWDLLARLGIPARPFGRVSAPGTLLGPLRQAIIDETGIHAAVIAAAGHDTASAVAAVPAGPDSFMYISCGTWSLAGVEIPDPIVDERSLAGNFTNESGVDGTIRFLKNIAGLWLVQECRHAWARRGEEHDYAELTALAAAAPAFKTILNPEDPTFLNPPDMPAAISAYARRTGQAEPITVGEHIRAALEGLALSHRHALMTLEGILGRRIEVIHMVGGGTKNELLCQSTADATGRPVIVGPTEATAAGNILTQAMALGYIGGLADAREIVRRSFSLRTYEPRGDAVWDEAFARWQHYAHQEQAES